MKSSSLAWCAAALMCTVAHADPTDQLSWLAGCWMHVGSDSGSMEMWTPPAGGVLLGLSRTVKNNQAVAHEFMQIRRTSDGLVFIARPSNQPEATFRAIRTSVDEVVFENLEHDFPQRVSYRRTTADSLVARIEGTRGGKARSIDYPMKRAKCESI